MLQESSNHHKKNKFSETINIAKEQLICKDGFCSLPNQKQPQKKDGNDTNIFDPIK